MAAQDVWKEAAYWHVINKYSTDAMGFVSMVFENDKKLDNNMSTVAMILWSLWWRRNQQCRNEKLPSVFETVRRTFEYLHDWRKAKQHGINAARRSTSSTTSRWSKPPSGVFKCNVDAASYVEQNIFCIGACIRDEHGRFVRAFTRRFDGVPEIHEAAAIGILETMKWMQSMNIYNFQLETDCMNVVQHLNSKPQDDTEYGIIIKNCRRLVCMNDNCRVTYVMRQANRVAHELTQAARFNASHQVFDYCPPCIEITIMNEMH